MQKRRINQNLFILIIIIILYILALILPQLNQSGTSLNGVSRSPPREAFIGLIILIVLALIIYVSERTYKYHLE